MLMNLASENGVGIFGKSMVQYSLLTRYLIM